MNWSSLAFIHREGSFALARTLFRRSDMEATTPAKVTAYFEEHKTAKIEDMADKVAHEVFRMADECYMGPLRLLTPAGAGGMANYATNELTAVCPMTGLPDFYQVTIRYNTSGGVIELKTLKEYLAAYRNLPILHEQLANKIHRDLSAVLVNGIVGAVEKLKLEVILVANVRGGISATVAVR